MSLEAKMSTDVVTVTPSIDFLIIGPKLLESEFV